jgi:drug/metabolite transporter (DMT)-like permease
MTTSRSAALPFAAFLGCCLIWGSTFLVIQLGNAAMPPFWAASLRLAIALALLLVLLRLLRIPFPRGAAFQAAATFGFLNFGISFVLLYFGETRVPSGLTAVLYATIPLSTSLFAWGFGLERLSRWKTTAALIALGGVLVIFAEHVRGDFGVLHLVAIVVAATSASLSGVMLKRGPRQHPLAANAAGAVAGLPVCLAASFLAGEAHAWPSGWPALGPLLYLATLGSIGAFGLYAWLVNRWPVSRISFIAVVVPVVAVILGAAIHHERLSSGQMLGSLIVVLAVGIAILSDRVSGTAATH